MRYRYHDSYALVELGDENIPQTEESILNASNKWRTFSTSESLIPVYSAYGGLSIYRYEAIKNLRYSLIENNDSRVEARCEHFAMCKAIREKRFWAYIHKSDDETKVSVIEYRVIERVF